MATDSQTKPKEGRCNHLRPNGRFCHARPIKGYSGCRHHRGVPLPGEESEKVAESFGGVARFQRMSARGRARYAELLKGEDAELASLKPLVAASEVMLELHLEVEPSDGEVLAKAQTMTGKMRPKPAEKAMARLALIRSRQRIIKDAASLKKLYGQQLAEKSILLGMVVPELQEAAKRMIWAMQEFVDPKDMPKVVKKLEAIHYATVAAVIERSEE